MTIGPLFLGCPYRGLFNIQTELPDSIIIFVIVISIINFSYFERITGNESNIYQIPVYIYIYIYHQFMTCVCSVEYTVDGNSIFVSTCQITQFSNASDHEMNYIENLSQGSCKFSAINLCLEMALSTNSTDSDCCVAVLWNCNVMGQTSQSKERNCVT